MSTSIDPFFNRTYSETYNCLHFVREVWFFLIGEDVAAKLERLVGNVAKPAAKIGGLKSFEHLKTPVSPCFIIMQRKNFEPHVGIFLNGRILHLLETGVEYQPLVVARRFFTSVRYYR